ncbi:hypothetical protein KIN20_020718 [Parelaphostrongylus tenuis]|uniref:Uncharacterized protein n=1 Tax=Parelaphostrongylus tenuis TaxID=148309 RepID=A0AAD5MT67_PARTN|nr:hypothetical protein KIN20_020718 [Parelaphostrongylus tenuis]
MHCTGYLRPTGRYFNHATESASTKMSYLETQCVPWLTFLETSEFDESIKARKARGTEIKVLDMIDPTMVVHYMVGAFDDVNLYLTKLSFYLKLAGAPYVFFKIDSYRSGNFAFSEPFSLVIEENLTKH